MTSSSTSRRLKTFTDCMGDPIARQLSNAGPLTRSGLAHQQRWDDTHLEHSRPSRREKIADDTKSCARALLRMKLHTRHPSALNSRNYRTAIRSGRKDGRSNPGYQPIAMHKKEVGAGHDPTEEADVSRCMHFIPPHMGYALIGALSVRGAQCDPVLVRTRVSAHLLLLRPPRVACQGKSRVSECLDERLR